MYDIYSRLWKTELFFSEVPLTMPLPIRLLPSFFSSKERSQKILPSTLTLPEAYPATLAMIDTMDVIKSDVSTVCVGISASGGALTLVCGTKGKRFTLPHSEVMIHQPLGGAEGQTTDIAIAASHIIKRKTF